MKNFAYRSLLLGLFLIPSLWAETTRTTFRINEMEFFKECPRVIYIKQVNEWKSGQPALWLSFEVKKDFPNPSFFIKAYFYGENEVILAKLNGITSGHRVKAGNNNDDSLFKTPLGYKKSENYTFHFLLPSSVNPNDVKRVLVVYGAENDLAWKATPNVTLDSIEFDEKSKLAATPESSE
ncbi:MAG: hypothetical protein V4507_03440 [Verrucomicrobiota bacterium]